MNNFVEEQLKNIGKSVQPSAAAEERILNNVMSSLESTNNKHISFFQNIMNFFKFNKPLYKVGLLAGVLVIMVTPALFLRPDITSDDYSVNIVTEQPIDNYYVGLEDYGDTKDTVIKARNSNPGNYVESNAIDSDRVKEVSASFGIKASNPKGIYDYLNTLGGKYGGYILSSRYNSGTTQNGYIKYRIPTENFYEFIEDLRSQDVEIVSESQQIDDLQNEIYSLESNVKSTQEKIAELEGSLQGLQGNELKSELEKTELQISQLKKVVESDQSEIKTLQSKGSLATIEVRINNIVVTNIFTVMAESFSAGVGFWSHAFGLIILPVAAGSLSTILVLRIVKRTRGKRKGQ